MRSIAVLLLAGLAACTQVDSTEHCVETRYGSVVTEKMENGLRFIGWNDATCFPLTEQNFPDQGKAETMEAQTSDPVTVTGDVSITYTYDPDNVFGTVFKQKRSQDKAETEVLNAIREGYRTAFSGWKVDQIFSSRRASLSDSVKAHIQRKIGTLAIIRQVFVRDIKIPEAIEAARIDAAKQDQLLDKAKKKSQTDSVVASATLFAAKADAEAKQLQATVYERSPKLIELEIAKEQAKICGAATTCILGGSVLDSWKLGGKP